MTMATPVPVCILTSQYFGWGIYGGFGSMSRKLAEYLVGAGWEVEVIVPRRSGQEPLEVINGVHVRSFSLSHPRDALALIRSSRARIFHSQDPTILTGLAEMLHPGRCHLVTCRDPRDTRDWWTEFRYATARRRLLTPLNYATEAGILVRSAVRRADGVYVPAHFLREKVRRMFRLRVQPEFLPNLIDVPETIPRKPRVPVFTFLARWDKRKRPELFLELAEQFPEYRFVAVGQGSASAESDYDRRLRSRFAEQPNLEVPGFINRFLDPDRMQALLSETWALVNTAAREGLPLSFLEAAAYGCAIVSMVDPDGFSSMFGVHVADGDFAAGIRRLMATDPQRLGAAAHSYVRDHYENSIALRAHCEEYLRHAGAKGL